MNERQKKQRHFHYAKLIETVSIEKRRKPCTVFDRQDTNSHLECFGCLWNGFCFLHIISKRQTRERMEKITTTTAKSFKVKLNKTKHIHIY